MTPWMKTTLSSTKSISIKTVYLKADIDPDHRDAVDYAAHTQSIPSEVATNPSSAPVADLRMPVTISEIISAQETDDLCQTVFAKMDHDKYFFIKG